MKTYQTPTILWQEMDLADILTESAIIPEASIFRAVQGNDTENRVDYWGNA